MRIFVYIPALVLGGLLLAGCAAGQAPPDSSAPESRGEESSAVSSAPDESATLYDGVVEDFLSDFTAVFAGIEPEMERDGVLYYPRGQKLILRDRERMDGVTKHLGVLEVTDEEWNSRLAAAFADSRNGRLLAAPRAVDMEVFDYSRDDRALTPEIVAADWVDDNYAYIATMAGVALFDSGAGQMIAASEDPTAIYSRAPGHAKSYLQPVNTAFAVDGRVYYTGFRDPVLLNANGCLYELGPEGERVISDDAYYVTCAGERAVVFERVVAGGDARTPNAQSLHFYDTRADEIVDIFTEVYSVLDGEYWTVGGQLLGNYWTDKQWEAAHPVRVEDGSLLRFYVSRIADGEVDEYAYDFDTRTLVHVGIAASALG